MAGLQWIDRFRSSFSAYRNTKIVQCNIETHRTATLCVNWVINKAFASPRYHLGLRLGGILCCFAHSMTKLGRLLGKRFHLRLNVFAV